MIHDTPQSSSLRGHHELKDAEQQQQRSGREVEHLQTQLSAATADAWTIRMVEPAASRHGVVGCDVSVLLSFS